MTSKNGSASVRGKAQLVRSRIPMSKWPGELSPPLTPGAMRRGRCLPLCKATTGWRWPGSYGSGH